MRWFRILALRLKTLVWRNRADSELEVEFEEFLALETAANVRAGMSVDEARYAAHRALGSAALYQEQCRDERRTGWVDQFTRDARYALRILASRPLFTAVAIVTLGLGIGANTAVFTLVSKFFLRPLPVKDPQHLVSLVHGDAVNFSYPNYRDIRDSNHVLSGLAAHRVEMLDLSIGGGRNSRLWGFEVTGNYFELLGTRPYLGRFFGPSDDLKRGANPYIVLSYGCWQSRFAGDPHVIGRKIKVNGFNFTVVGVAPQEFTGTELVVNPEFWVPMSMAAQVEPGSNWLDCRSCGNVWVLGRLSPGVTRIQAQGSLQRLAKQLAHDYPKENERLTIDLTTPGLIGNALRKPVGEFAATLMAVAGLVLLLACINLAGLLLARASERRKEIAVRLSMGAARTRLIRQLLTESLLLAGGGAILGLLLAYGVMRALRLWNLPVDIPIDTAFSPDFRVLGFTCLLALITTFLCGLVPALQSTRVDLIPALKNDSPRERARRLSIRDVLVIAQISLSIILLIASLLAVRSMQNAFQIPLGFDPAHAVSVSFDLNLQGYSEDRGREFQRRLLETASTMPGIQAAGIINNPPLRIGEDDEEVSMVGTQLDARRAKRLGAHLYNISPGYLRAAGTRLLTGRDINAHDRAGTPLIALVNKTFVQKLLPGEDPIGKRFRLGPGEKLPVFTIAGVVEPGKYDSLGEDPDLAVFVPIAQRYNGWTTLVARTTLPPAQALEELRRAVAELDNDMPLFNVETLGEGLAWALLPARFAAGVLGAFGTVAVLLAAIGIFALVAYGISARSREIGIRMALGARAAQVLALVMRRTAVLCAIGVVIGTALAFAASQALASFLYGISPRDPLTYGLSLLLLTAVTVLACWQPAQRAIRVDPAQTLRNE